MKPSPYRAQTIITVRHGEQLKLAGKLDDNPGLTERGREQIKRSRNVLSLLLGRMSTAVCVSSPLLRAVETTEILASDGLFQKRDIVYDDGLRERSLGILNPRDMKTDLRFADSKKSALHWEPDEGESLDALIQGRVGEAVERAQNRARIVSAGALVFVAHGGVNHAFMRLFTGMSDRQLTYGPLVPGSDIEALQNPGYITHGQMHIYTLPTPESAYYTIRTTGVDPLFDSGDIVIERD